MNLHTNTVENSMDKWLTKKNKRIPYSPEVTPKSLLVISLTVLYLALADSIEMFPEDPGFLS